MLQCVYVCVRVRVCIPCTFITPIARDPLFGLLHNRRRRRLRATYTHIMQVKMEPNQRGYTLHSAQHKHSYNRVFCVSLTRHRPLWRSSQSARARSSPPKKKGGKNNPEDYCCGRHPFLSVRKIAPRERDSLPRRGRRPRDDRGVWSLLITYRNERVCIYNERGGKW